MSASVEVFKKYWNPVFIETGSQFGDGIQMALDAGYEVVVSCDANYDCWMHCMYRFVENDSVGITCEDSVQYLSRISFPKKATIWLDAHNENDYPVLAELDQIAKWTRKDHTILIDDLRMFPTDKNGLSVEQIKEKILSINPNYTFCFEDGYTKNDILVAKVE